MKRKLFLLLALVLTVSLCTVSVLAAHVHTWNEPTFYETTNNIWKADFTCSGCDETKTVDCTVYYNGARYVIPTCTQPEIEAYIVWCSLDGKEYTHDYEITGDIMHSWAGGDPSAYSVVWSGDCKTATFTLTCNVCGATHVESVDTTSSTTPATCTKDGEITYKAFLFARSNGASTFNAEKTVTIPGGHDYGEPKFTWFDYGNVTAEFTCKRDSTHTKSIECTVFAEEIPATCTKDGQIVFTAACTLDGNSYTDKKTEPSAALGHNYIAFGKQYICSRCDESYSLEDYTVTVQDSVNGTVTADVGKAFAGSTVTLTVTPSQGRTLETLTVTDRDGKKIDLTAVTIGEQYTFRMPASDVTVAATFMEDNSILNYFIDIPTDSYYYPAVLWAAENGIAGGVDNIRFSPDGSCTRAQAVTFLWRAAGSPSPKATELAFTDVPSGAYYETAVLWAVENGITKGTSDTTFDPDAACTRAQIVTFLYRSEQLKGGGMEGAWMLKNPFADVNTEAFYGEAVLWAVANQVTSGTTATTFSPDADCTRAQIITFIYRALAA